MSVSDVLKAFAALSVQRPAGFIVAHFFFFGPLVVLALLNWKSLAAEAGGLGNGAIAFLAALILMGLNSESRHLVMFVPLLAALTMKAAQRNHALADREAILVGLLGCFWLAKPWLYIGPLASGIPEAWPDVLFYEGLGPWMPTATYGLYLFILVMLLLYFRRLSAAR